MSVFDPLTQLYHRKQHPLLAVLGQWWDVRGEMAQKESVLYATHLTGLEY